MNTLLWVLQILAAIVYRGVGRHEGLHVRQDQRESVPSFGALPREAWTATGHPRMVCVVGLIVPGALHWHPPLTDGGRHGLGAREPRVHRVHVKYHEIPPIIMSGVLGVLMAFIAYGRMVLSPIL